LLALALNKQLDVQTMLTRAARNVANTVGVYQHRRMLQVAFVALVTMGILSAAGAAARAGKLHALLRRYSFACAGVAILVAFVLVRAAAFHHVTPALAAPLPMLLELVGASLIAAEACRALAYHRRSGSSARGAGRNEYAACAVDVRANGGSVNSGVNRSALHAGAPR
jgi:hypothetical protein